MNKFYHKKVPHVLTRTDYFEPKHMTENKMSMGMLANKVEQQNIDLLI